MSAILSAWAWGSSDAGEPATAGTQAQRVSTLLDQLSEVVGGDRVIRDGAAMAPYLEERRGLFSGQTLAVVLPATTDEVARVVRLCRDADVGIVPQGGNTGLCGGGVPHAGEVVIGLGRLNRIREIDPDNFTITVEAGCILAEVQRAAHEHGRFFPLSLGAEGSCQIGGNLATNAGGINVLRYGNARDLVFGLEVVLPDGDIWEGLNGLRKNNTGYDLKNLFVGAEGTLGIITAAVLKLFPAPTESPTAFVGLSDLSAAVELLARARGASGDAVSSFELLSRTCLELALRHIPACRNPLAAHYDWYVLTAFTGTRAGSGMRDALEDALGSALEDGLISDAVISESEAQSRALWRLREAIVEAQALEGASVKHDVSVNVSQVPTFITTAISRVESALPGVRPCVFGHIGDGNIHFNLLAPSAMEGEAFLERAGELSRVIYDAVVEMGGSFSAEHGIGLLKLAEMARFKSPVELRLMRTIKQALDPKGLMNPGKVLPR